MVCYRTPTILSPIPAAFSQMLSGYINKNPDVVTSKVADELNRHHIAYTSITVDGSDIHIQLDDTTAVLISIDKDISVQLDSLQYTMAHLTIEGKRIARVDMRFERPVVTFK